MTPIEAIQSALRAALVDDGHEDRLFEVWRKNQGVLDQPAAATVATVVRV